MTILESVKDALMIGLSDTSYDDNLWIYIVSAIEKLHQNGITKDIPLTSAAVIDDIVVDKLTPSFLYKSMVVSYIILQTQIVFNPPQDSVVKILNQQSEEYIWRLRTAMENF